MIQAIVLLLLGAALVVLPILGVLMLLRFAFHLVLLPFQILGAVLGIAVGAFVLAFLALILGPILGLLSAGIIIAALPAIIVGLALFILPVAALALLVYVLYRLLRSGNRESTT